MDEIKKRINELEAERNDQLRYTFIESQLKKFKAIKYSNKIRYLKGEIDNRSTLLAANESNLDVLTKNRDELRDQINKIDQEKSSFMNQVDISNKSRAQIDTKLSDVVYNIERDKAIIKEARSRLAIIEERFSFMNQKAKILKLNWKLVSDASRKRKI